MRPWRVPVSTVALGVLGLVSGSAILGCSFEPQSTAREYRLAEPNEAALAKAFDETRADAVGAQVRGALEMLFGTPADPRFVVLEDWWDEEVDPNDASFELSDEAFDGVKADNLKRFRRQLFLLEARRYTEVPEPLYAEDLWAAWQADHLPGLLEDPEVLFDPDYEEDGSRHEAAASLFESWYPTLSESAEMYRIQCLHCHGNEGGGNGLTAEYLSPRPRDYRLGIFKWVAVDRNFRPRRADLYKVLHDGAYFTAMPSFARFSSGELNGLVDYVRLLSIRGETESLLVGEVVEEDYLRAESVLDNYNLVWGKWNGAEEKYVSYDGQVPTPDMVTPEMLAHGRELFLGTVANCYTCHGTDGRGNGESLFEPDPDGLTETNDDGEEVPVLIKRKDEWGDDSEPRNFHMGVFHGGGRPIDLFRRVKYGISGTIMPAADSSLTDDDLWTMVYYVLSIVEDNDVNRILEARALAAVDDGHGDDHGESHGDSDHDDSDHDHSGDSHETQEEGH